MHFDGTACMKTLPLPLELPLLPRRLYCTVIIDKERLELEKIPKVMRMNGRERERRRCLRVVLSWILE